MYNATGRAHNAFGCQVRIVRCDNTGAHQLTTATSSSCVRKCTRMTNCESLSSSRAEVWAPWRSLFTAARIAVAKPVAIFTDVQKLSKQAIFSLHRGNAEEAGKRLDQAATAAQQIMPLIEQEPTLRGGSFSSAMEEVRLCAARVLLWHCASITPFQYAEAKIFSHFLQHTRLLPSAQLPMVNRDECVDPSC